MSVKSNEITREENKHTMFVNLFDKMLEICHSTTVSFDELVEMDYEDIEKALDYYQKTYKEHIKNRRVVES